MSADPSAHARDLADALRALMAAVEEASHVKIDEGGRDIESVRVICESGPMLAARRVLQRWENR